MKRFLCAAFLTAASLIADNVPEILMMGNPVGFCLIPAPVPVLCTPLEPTYLIVVKSLNPLAVAFRVHVTVKLEDGSVVVRTLPVVDRRDNDSGWSTIGVFSFGGKVVGQLVLSADELGVVGGIVR